MILDSLRMIIHKYIQYTISNFCLIDLLVELTYSIDSTDSKGMHSDTKQLFSVELIISEHTWCVHFYSKDIQNIIAIFKKYRPIQVIDT
jgi:hypothetical protein